MPVAGVVVVPRTREHEDEICRKLNALDGATVKGCGTRGIALVLEAGSVGCLKKVSEAISRWEDVADLQLAYLNWEDGADSHPAVRRPAADREKHIPQATD